MGVGLIVVKTAVGSDDWTNTWGVKIGDTTSALVEGEIEALLAGGTPDNPALSDTTPQGNFQGDVSPLYSILAFHRRVTIGPARITGVYITDGKRNNQVTPTNVYASYATSLASTYGTPVEDNAGIVPLSICWLINRNVAGFGHKPGRLYLRHALPDTAVRPGTRDGVDWQTAAIGADQAAALALYVEGSGLGAWFANGAPADNAIPAQIGLPVYAGEFATGQAGNLMDVLPLASLSSHNPVSRQMTRGRRRAKATNQS